MRPAPNGAAIRAIREAKGLTLQDLADRMGKRSVGYLSRIELGAQSGVRCAPAIARALGVHPAVITSRRSPLAVLRSIMGIHVDDLAAAVGAPRETIEAVERNEVTPDPALAEAIAEHLHIDAAALLPPVREVLEAAS